MKFKLFNMDQVASDTDIENLLHKVQQGETVNTISSADEVIYLANSILNPIFNNALFN